MLSFSISRGSSYRTPRRPNRARTLPHRNRLALSPCWNVAPVRRFSELAKLPDCQRFHKPIRTLALSAGRFTILALGLIFRSFINLLWFPISALASGIHALHADRYFGAVEQSFCSAVSAFCHGSLPPGESTVPVWLRLALRRLGTARTGSFTNDPMLSHYVDLRYLVVTARPVDSIQIWV